MEKLLLIFFALFSFSSCNFWDNIFSNLNGPQFDVPKEFSLQLTNIDTNNVIAELLFSVSFNSMRLSLFDKNVTKGFLPEFANITLPKVTTMYTDFNKGIISFDFNSSCYWKNVSALKLLTSEFLIKSYDIFTFLETRDNDYHFVFTNPLSSKVSQITRKDSILDMNLKEVFDEVDRRAIIDFTVNKNSMLLETINIKYQNIKYINMKVEVETNKKFSGSDFDFNYKNCKEIQGLNSTINGTVTEQAKEILSNTTKKFLP